MTLSELSSGVLNWKDGATSFRPHSSRCLGSFGFGSAFDMAAGDDQCAIELFIRCKCFRTASGAEREIFNDFSLSLAEGQVHVLFGPSGCGKTTLLRILVGLDSDFQGTVEMPEKPVIGMVFQEPRLLPWRTVLQNLRLAAPRTKESVLILIATELGLAEHLQHFPGELSLGLARRVALARALAVNPDLLVLDEPFVSLDSALAARLRDELAVLIDKTKATTLLVTHDLDEAVRLADQIMLLAGHPTQVAAQIKIERPRKHMTESYASEVKAKIRALIANRVASEARSCGSTMLSH
jgi:ABC-type nitrate/sulfonate/bicarbonate transport system ATPase subunit